LFLAFTVSFGKSWPTLHERSWETWLFSHALSLADERERHANGQKSAERFTEINKINPTKESGVTTGTSGK
jgi:hypothetical protein